MLSLSIHRISFPKTKTQVFNVELTNSPALFSIAGGKCGGECMSSHTLAKPSANKDQGSFTDLRVSKAIEKFNEMRPASSYGPESEYDNKNKANGTSMCAISSPLWNASEEMS